MCVCVCKENKKMFRNGLVRCHIERRLYMIKELTGAERKAYGFVKTNIYYRLVFIDIFSLQPTSPGEDKWFLNPYTD